MITITIDGKEIKTEENKTILEVAKENGIYIPTLCHYENLFPIGSCRLCIVEIEGFEKPQTACTTYVSDEMRIVTSSEKLFQMRREFLKILLMEHPLDCPQCDKAGECKLQDLVYEHKIEKAEYKINIKKERIESFSTPLIRKWPQRCVLCLRCYHACKEISGREVLGINGGGLKAKIEVLNPKECISCGECLNVCPVGALTENLSLKKTRPWMAQENVLTTCPHCGFGCALILVFQNGYLSKIKTERKVAPNFGSLCVRGRFGYDFVVSELKIGQSFARIYDEKRELSLDEAQSELLSTLKGIEKEGGKIGFLLSPRLTNEEAYLIYEFGRNFSKAFFSSSSYFFTYKLLKMYKKAGIRYGYDYDDLNKCDLIFVIGADLLTDNHVFGVRLRDVLKRKGIKIVAIDQIEGPFFRVANLGIKLRIGSESLLLDLVAKNMAEKGKKGSGIRNYKEYEEYISGLKESDLSEFCGIDIGEFKELLTLIDCSKEIGVVFGSAISEEGIASIVNFSLLSGAHLFPVVDEANGIGLSTILKEMVDPVEMFSDKEIKAILVFEEEPSQFIPNEIILQAAKEKYLVHFTFLPTPLTEVAHLVIPSGGFHEKEGTYVSGSGRISPVRKIGKQGADGILVLRAILSKLNWIETKRDVKKDIEEYLSEEKERSYIIPLGAWDKFKKGLICTHRDVFKNPYLRHSKGVSIIDRDMVYISRKDAEALRLKDGEEVKISSSKASIRKSVSIHDGLREGVLLFKPHFDFEFVNLFEKIDSPLEVKVEKI